jgi:sulfite reductase (NADPH) hemoprotein beta-component
MYRYDAYDQRIVDERVAQFRDQTRRYLAGELTDDEFRPLRLQNGLYVQRHAPMLRVAVPYGLLSSRQLRKLAEISRKYDRGYGHFSTRQNLQYNWPSLESVPDILAELATVQMHAIQTSGNCVRNITTDQFAGVAPDEIVDPRPWAEILRQWSTFHPEFAFLPRKFKIAICGSQPRSRRHPGARHRTSAGAQRGRHAGLPRVRRRWARPYADHRQPDPRLRRVAAHRDVLRGDHPRLQPLWPARQLVQGAHQDPGQGAQAGSVRAEGGSRMGAPEGRPGHADAGRSGSHRGTLQCPGVRDPERAGRRLRCEAGDGSGVLRLGSAQRPRAQGARLRCRDAVAQGHRRTARRYRRQKQLDVVADLADRYSFGELRVSHEQNLDARRRASKPTCMPLWLAARAAGLATPNIGLHHRHRLLPRGRFLLAGQREEHSDRRGHPAASSTISTTCTTSATSS